jgi:hypothetical protein
MATVITKTIRTSGGDYTTLAAAESGEQALRANLVGSDEQLTFECYAGVSDGPVTFAGWTVDSTRFIKVIVPPAERHAGVWDDTKYRITSTVGAACVEVQISYMEFTGLQVSTNNTSELCAGIIAYNAGAAMRLVDSCIIRSTVACIGPGLGYQSSTAAGHLQVYINNIVYGYSGTNGLGIYARGNGSTSRVIGYNNTVYNCYTGIRSRDDNCLYKNNLVIGCVDAFLPTTAFENGTSYNAYDEGTDPGTNGIDLSGSTDAQIFTDATIFNFHLIPTSTAKDVGTTLSGDSNTSVTLDIDGATRIAPWDVGADEYTIAGLVSTYTVSSRIMKVMRP